MRLLLVSLIPISLLGACGGNPAAKGGAAGGPSAKARPFGTDWAKNACETLPMAKASEAAGIPVGDAKVSTQNDLGHTVLSTCNYNAEGEILDGFTVALRQDNTGDDTMAEHIAELSEGDGELGPAEELAVEKGQARWLPRMHQVVYFPDDARVIYVVGPGVNPIGFGPKSLPDEITKPRSLRIALAAAGG